MEGAPREIRYGEEWAPHYDSRFDEVDPGLIDFLEGHAGESKRALELAVGTGRVAIPLAQRGVSVTGIDLSPAMLDVLGRKPGGDEVKTVEGDMSEVPVDEAFPLIFVVFNSFFAMLTQERQVRCFENVAAHLEPGGRFVLECFVPDLRRYNQSNTHISVLEIAEDWSHSYDMAVLTPEDQHIDSHYVVKTPDGEDLVLPVALRFAWPSELDLMARIAGLELEARFGGFDRSDFDSSSTTHVSVYRKP